MPCRAARPERGWTKPAWPSGIATARPVPTVARSPGPSSTRSHAERSRPASPSYARVGSVASSCRRLHGQLGHAPVRRCLGLRRALLGDQVGGEAAQLAPRQARDDEHALGRVLALVDRRAERVELVQPCPLRRTAAGGARARTARRSARRSAHAARRAPRRSARRSAARRGSGSRAVAGRACRRRRSC